MWRVFAKRSAVWGRVDAGLRIGVKYPPKPDFWGVNTHFRPNAHYIKTRILSNYCTESSQILYGGKCQQILFVAGPDTRVTNTRWRMAAILKKNEKSLYLGKGFTDRHEILRGEASW